MAIADTSRGVLRYAEETTIGTASDAALKEVRFTGESLSQSKTTETSNEIRSDRQITDIIAVDSEPSGEFNYELSYDNLDEFIPGALLGDWTAAVLVSETDISASDADNSYNTTGGDFVADGVVVGMWLKPAGFTNAANNQLCKVVSVATTKIVVSGSTLVTESSGTRTLKNDGMCRNGVTPHGFTMEKEFADVGEFISYVGMEVSSMGLEVASNAIVTGTLGFIGRTAASAQATISQGSPIQFLDAPTNDVFNATSNVTSIRENGTALAASSYYASAISVNIDNGLRGQKAVGTDGNVGVGKGRCTVTGTLSSYFSDAVMLDKFLNQTATSLDFTLTDGAGNIYVVTMPNVKFTSGNPEISGIDADVALELEYQALRDATTDCTIQIDKFAA